MRRSAGLAPTPVVAVVPATEVTQPAVAPAPVAADPPVPPAAPPVIMVAPPTSPPVVVVAPPTSQPQPAASLQALDARAPASRAITRELAADPPGPMPDLKTPMQLEPY